MCRLLCLVVMVVAGCGASDGADPAVDGDPGIDATESDDAIVDDGGPSAGPVTPVVTSTTFPTLHAGDELTLVGVHFLPPGQGTVAVRFAGAFSSDQTSWYDVDFRVPATPVSSTRARLVFEPGFPPDGFGRVLGTFEGTMVLININPEGRETPSRPVKVELEAGRSLLIHGIRPLGADCGTAFATKVRDQSALAFELEVLGFAQPSGTRPIRIAARWDDGLTAPVDELLTFAGAIEVQAPPAWQGPGATLVLTAEAEGPDAVSRRLTFASIARYAIAYDGASSIVERYPPVRVTDCLGPGTHPYSESASEGRTRSYTISGTVNSGVGAISEAFGLGVTSSVSSGTGTGLGVTGLVVGGMHGVFFRQTLRLARIAALVEHDVCGVPTQVGEVVVTDWAWVPGFNQLNGACPPYPEPLLSASGDLLMP